jgi:hypothetical protein
VLPVLKRALELFAPPAGSALRARVLRGLGRVWFFALLLAVCYLYRFIGSAGLDAWPVYGVYHDLQADGFLHGHLSLPITPAPELLHAKNPYDYANVNYWWLDATYYRGKYYMYWGPVPALFEAAAKFALRIREGLGDQYIACFFHCLAFWCGALLILRVLERLFGSTSRWLLALGVLVFACANPTPHGVATLSTYQTALIAGQAWLMLGLLVAFDAVWYAGSERARFWRLPVAGTCYALAIGSRVSVLPAVAVLALFLAVTEAWPSAHRFRRFLVNALLLGAPLVAGGVGLLVFNKLRFDDYLEFGSKIQLSAYPIKFSPRWVVANLYSYALRPATLSCEFPYLHQVWSMGEAAFPKSFPRPPDYQVLEPVVGWALAAPITWLAPFSFVLAPGFKRFSNQRDRAFLFCLACFSVLASLTGAIVLFVYGATMRYLTDVTFGLVLLGLLGSFSLRFHRWGAVAPRFISGVIATLGLTTVAMGLLLGYQGYNLHFQRFNPDLDERIANALSFCGPHFHRSKAPAWGR